MQTSRSAMRISASIPNPSTVLVVSDRIIHDAETNPKQECEEESAGLDDHPATVFMDNAMQHTLPAVPRLDNSWCNLHCKSPYATYAAPAFLIRENLDCREPGTLPRSATSIKWRFWRAVASAKGREF
jgi:hypothetical protein